MNKIYFYLGFLILIFLLTIDSTREIARNNLPGNLKIKVKEIFFGKTYLNRIKTLNELNYNVALLPQTQFEKVYLKKIKINNFKISEKSNYQLIKNSKKKLTKFYIAQFNNNIILSDSKGNFFYLENVNKTEQLKINTNANKLNIFDVKDINVKNDRIFITYSKKIKKNCYSLVVANAQILKKNLNFSPIYESKSCIKNVIAGKMHNYTFKGSEGLIITTGDDGRGRNYAQKNDTIFGKIFFLDLKTKRINIFSKGHRNPQGLSVFKDKILSTEHGPRGGDEINLITTQGNDYGWPTASYGEPYDKKAKKYKDNHEELGYVDPIYSFVPSIGISQITYVPESFSKKWKDNFLVASLNGRSLFRIKMNSDFSKILFFEKIFIGERIRDVEYLVEEKAFLLALEDSGSLAVLTMNNG